MIAARAIVASGGYEKLYKKHIATPPDDVFESIEKLKIPNYSVRMSNLHAAVLIPQIAIIEERRALCNMRFEQVCVPVEVSVEFCCTAVVNRNQALVAGLSAHGFLGPPKVG